MCRSHRCARGDGLYVASEKIDVLYRLYPLEQLAADRPARLIFDLVRDGKLRLLNPASALIAQSKMLMVVIWGLAKRTDVLTAAQRVAVERTFLPTFADVPVDGRAYVSKCVLGREGDSIAVIRFDGSTIESRLQRYAGQPRVYQRYVPLPRWSARTSSGRRVEGRVMTSCFIAAGEPGAVGVRIGGEITDPGAFFAPVGTPLER